MDRVLELVALPEGDRLPCEKDLLRRSEVEDAMEEAETLVTIFLPPRVAPKVGQLANARPQLPVGSYDHRTLPSARCAVAAAELVQDYGAGRGTRD